VWRRETTAEGKKVACVEWTIPKCSYRISVHVRRFQWEQSRMYMGFSGDNRVCMRAIVETDAYFRTCSSG
jgi:hypothetical protein